MKKPLLPALLLTLAAALPLAAQAGPKADALGACLADSTTGKDRKDLAMWVFVAISVHPEIQPLATVTEQSRDKADDAMAKLFTTLLTERCRTQAREVVQQEGAAGMGTAFHSLGALAMQELMSNPAVGAAIGGFERKLDQAKIQAALNGN